MILARLAGGLCVLLLAAGGVHGASALPAGWDAVPAEAAAVQDPGERVAQLSARFLGTPYRAQTLVGAADTPEQLIIRFDAVDCFTFLDYVEALRRSADAGAFRERLIEVRYRDGIVAWDRRRHFFTDWAAAAEGRVAEVTAEVGGERTQQASKLLNRKADGTLYLPGIAVREQSIRFIPGTALDEHLLARLQTGDYLGIYTPAAGLDVTHVGIVVRQGGGLFLRHASSRRGEQRVIDSDLRGYLAGKPGIVVLRPR